MYPLIGSSEPVDCLANTRDAGGTSEPRRIMVVGEGVMVVQRVSRYCLTQGADVLPFYGLPDADAIALFDPHVLVLCLPLAASFLVQVERPYLLWAEQPAWLAHPTATGSGISTPTALANQLQAMLN